ncbi:hypothetical protein NE865_09009 [Phthorimaea operculella]|nr:hypothetical protein NE865_09009 [Phthorimaea operculella]
MSGDTDKAKISDNQDEDKKSGAGDGHTTEDESSQDSKGESQGTTDSTSGAPSTDTALPPTDPPKPGGPEQSSANEAPGLQGKADVDQPNEEKPPSEGDVKANGNGKDEDAGGDDSKDDSKEDVKADDAKKEENGEHDEEEDEKDDVKEKPKAKKPAAKKAKKEPKKEPTEPPVPLPAGKGIPLGHISAVEISLSRFKTQDQKLLHQYLYGQLCLDRNVKRNIKKFKGYEWAIGSSEYKAKLEETSKMENKQLRTMCEMLDLDKKGSPHDLATRLVGFLQCPTANSPHARGSARSAPREAPASTPGGRPRRSAATKLHNRGYSDEEYESDPETKVKGPKPKAGDGSEDSDGSFNPSGSEEADSDFDPEAGDSPAGGGTRKRKSGGSARRRSSKGGKKGRKAGKGKKGRAAKPGRGRRAAKSESEEESEKSESEDEENESGSEGEESDEPKSKRGRAAAPVAKGRKGPVAKNAKATPVKRKQPTPPAKKKPCKPAAKPAKKGKKASSEEESGSGSEEEEDEEEGGSEEEESGEESDAPADKKAKRPPTDEEIKKYVKQILEGANLEQITMKTVCKQVYSHYPDFDLAHKKDFIKATVKSVSAPASDVKQILEGANLEQITMKTVCKQVYSHYPDFDLAHKKDFIKATVKSCI